MWGRNWRGLLRCWAVEARPQAAMSKVRRVVGLECRAALVPALAVGLLSGAAVADDPLRAGSTTYSGPVFTNVTFSAGVNYDQKSPATVGCVTLGYCEPEAMSGGAAVADVNLDGWLDLLVTRIDDHDLLFLNQGDGTFIDGTAASGLDAFDFPSNGAFFADIDNDGDPDLIVTAIGNLSATTRLHLYVNDGSGAFSEVAGARGVVSTGGAKLRLYSAMAGDYDNDGWLDLHVNDWLPVEGSDSRLYRNQGAASPGHFLDVTFTSGVFLPFVNCFASAFADLDGDGLQDLAVAADFGTSKLLWNQNGTVFTDGTMASGVGTDENGMGSTIADYDGDGDLDWFVTSIFDADATCDSASCNWGYSGNRLYRNEGNRNFVDATDLAGVREGGWGWGAAFFDFDNDRDLDLVMTNGVDLDVDEDAQYRDDPMRFWINPGNGVSMRESSSDVGVTDDRSGKGLLVFDYDRDGDQDLFVVNNDDTPVLYRNDGGNAQDWLRVDAEGTLSNRDGLGAKVYLQQVEGGQEQLAVIGSVSHFLGQSEKVAHFGLGTMNEPSPVYRVRIVWPSGIEQELFDVARNQQITIVESACIDGDADGYCSDVDCNDGNADAYPGAVEINDGIDNQCPGDSGHGLTDETAAEAVFAAGSPPTYSWPAQAGATAYQVARADAPDFSAGCVIVPVTQPWWADPQTPAVGAAYYYLNRAASPQVGSWGANSAALERTACN